MNFGYKGTSVIFETILLYYAIDYYDWGGFRFSAWVSAAGFLGLVYIYNSSWFVPSVIHEISNITKGFIAPNAADYILTQFGELVITCSTLLLSLTMGAPTFISCLFLFFSVAYPLGHTALLSYHLRFNAALPTNLDRLKAQTLFAYAGLSARIIMPTVAGAIVQSTSNVALFSALTVLHGGAALALLYLRLTNPAAAIPASVTVIFNKSQSSDKK